MSQASPNRRQSNGASSVRLRCAASAWVLLAAGALVLSSSLSAQTWTTQATIQVRAAATTNGGLAPAGEQRKDLVTTLQPTFQLSGQGARLRLNALVSADLVNYARDSQPDRASPRVRFDLGAALAERLLFVDSSIDVHQTEVDPFAPRAEIGAGGTRQTSSTYRVSPYLTYALSPQSTLLARHEEMLSQSDSGATPNQRFSRTRLRAERRPTPYGGSLELSKEDARFSGNGEGRWTIESGKAIGDVAINAELVVGPIIGVEQTTFLLERHRDHRYGAHLRWSPGERTQLLAELEHRFFGTGWDLSLRHRTPFMSFSLRWNRTPVTSTTSVGAAPAGTDLSTFLDAILTTRFPDAAARAALVSSLISTRGLRTKLPGAIEIFADYAQLQNGATATWVLLGSRNTVTLSVYQQTLRQFTRSGDVIGGVQLAGADNRQAGATLGLNRRLTPQMAVDLTSTWSRITGLAARSGDRTAQRTHRLSVLRALSERTGLSLGVQYDKLGTTVVGIDSYDAASAFIGLNHRF